eukprot:1824865-Amphidinium_carterae.1
MGGTRLPKVILGTKTVACSLSCAALDGKLKLMLPLFLRYPLILWRIDVRCREAYGVQELHLFCGLAGMNQ